MTFNFIFEFTTVVPTFYLKNELISLYKLYYFYLIHFPRTSTESILRPDHHDILDLLKKKTDYVFECPILPRLEEMLQSFAKYMGQLLFGKENFYCM